MISFTPPKLTPGKESSGAHEIADLNVLIKDISVAPAGDRPRQLGHEAGSLFTVSAKRRAGECKKREVHVREVTTELLMV